MIGTSSQGAFHSAEGLSPKVRLLYREGGPFDAIAEHGRRTARALGTIGVDATYDGGGTRGLSWGAARGGWVILEYNPYSYAQWGIAPHLLGRAFALTRRAAGPRLAIFVHEAFEQGPVGPRRKALAAWHRFQVTRLARFSECVFASTEFNARTLRDLAPGARVVHVPIPSNISREATTADGARDLLGVDKATFVVGLFGGDHNSRAMLHVAHAVDALAALEAPVLVMNLGNGAAELEPRANVQVRTIGALGAAELSRYLLCCDLYLAPFTDGVSTRRTTVAAALLHGLPVLGTSGHSTDSLLTAHPEALRLVDIHDVDGFASEALSLARDERRRSSLSEQATRLYRDVFSSEAVAMRIADALGLQLSSPVP